MSSVWIQVKATPEHQIRPHAVKVPGPFSGCPCSGILTVGTKLRSLPTYDDASIPRREVGTANRPFPFG